MVALQPFVEDDVETGLRRVAHEHRRFASSRGARRIPFDLVRQFVDERGRIELSRIAGITEPKANIAAVSTRRLRLR